MQYKKKCRRRKALKNRIRKAGKLGMLVIVIATIAIGCELSKGNGTSTQINQTDETEFEEIVIQETQIEEVSEVSEIQTHIYKFESTPNTVTISNEEIISSNVILVDESTDTMIAERGAMERISPASMTKVLTILVAAEHILPEQQISHQFQMPDELHGAIFCKLYSDSHRSFSCTLGDCCRSIAAFCYLKLRVISPSYRSFR